MCLLHNTGNAGSQHDCLGRGHDYRRQAFAATGPTANRIIQRHLRPWWGAAGGRPRGKYRSPITVYCFWMNCRNSRARVLESLRQPLETGKITVARANSHVTYPANVQLIAAMNPCRCGYLDDASRACGKAPRCGVDYQSKISGPFA